MNARLIFIISFSALVVLVVCCGAVSILIRWRKVGRPSNAVGPVFTPSTNKRPGKFLGLFLLVRKVIKWFRALWLGNACQVLAY